MPATNAWFRRRFLSSPGWRLIRSRQTSSVRAGSSASGPWSCRPARPRVARRPRAAGRPCPSGSGRDSGSRGSRRSRASRTPRTSTRRHRAAPRAREPNPSTTAVLLGMLRRRIRQLEAPGQHRVDDDRVALEVQEQELAAPPDGGQPLADEGLQLGRRAADRERRDRARGTDRPAGEGRVERLGDDRQVGEFGHGRPIVADCWCQNPCARLSRPSGPPQLKSDEPANRERRSGPRSRSPRTT